LENGQPGLFLDENMQFLFYFQNIEIFFLRRAGFEFVLDVLARFVPMARVYDQGQSQQRR